jgi:hypothetical protein
MGPLKQPPARDWSGMVSRLAGGPCPGAFLDARTPTPGQAAFGRDRFACLSPQPGRDDETAPVMDASLAVKEDRPTFRPYFRRQ